MDGSEVTGPGDNPAPPPPIPPPASDAPPDHLVLLTQEINEMRQELVLIRNQMQAMNANDGNGNNPNPNPPPPVRNIRNSSLNSYPDIDKLCKSLYLYGPDIMEAKTAIEWLKSLHTLTSILRCIWILETPPQRPDVVTDVEVYHISLEIMSNFHHKIPRELKVALPLDVDDTATTPSVEYSRLMEHLAKPNPYLYDNFRVQLESRSIGKSEKISKFMKWHHELRAQMVDTQFPDIESEATTIKWFIRGLDIHTQYNQLVSSWRASGPPDTLSEFESILSNEEAELDRTRRMDNQLQSLLCQMNKKPMQSGYNYQ